VHAPKVNLTDDFVAKNIAEYYESCGFAPGSAINSMQINNCSMAKREQNLIAEEVLAI
jgi:hypothetical protein